MREPSRSQVDRLRSEVLAWYARERRDFPWRGTRDPYAVLVSEMMLQQTQAARVVDRYRRFMARFPTAERLAAATPAGVLAEWAGLGYNRRALALQRCAATVVRNGWPSDVAGLEQLPGVGPYTARALASLAFGVPVGVVDTNVRRWLIRRFEVIDKPRPLQALADQLAAGARNADQAASWTHAGMELGASVCRARSRLCAVCPIADGCPSRDAAAPVPIPHQAPYQGSDRAARGALVRALAGTKGHAIEAGRARVGICGDLDDAAFERIVSGMERDGLLHRSGGSLRLGAATIGP